MSVSLPTAKEETESEPEASPDRSPVRDEEPSNNTEGELKEGLSLETCTLLPP
jgi:hypothetical protein